MFAKTKPLEQFCREQAAKSQTVASAMIAIEDGLVVVTIRPLIPGGDRLVFRVLGDALTPIPQAKPPGT